jgi:hypothetical protein
MLPWHGVEHISWASVVVLSAPWDFLMLGRLAALLRQRYADLIWVRLTARDDDPGQLLLALLGALTRLHTGQSAEIWGTATHWARRGEWRRAYQLLGEVLSAAAARPTALVLENTEHLDSGHSPPFRLLVQSLKSAVQDGLDIILAGGVQQRSWRLGVDGIGDPVSVEVTGPALPTDLYRLVATVDIYPADHPPDEPSLYQKRASGDFMRVADVPLGSAPAVA